MIRPEGPSAAALRGPPRTYPAYPRVDPRRDGITPPGDAAFVAPAACARARPDQLVARERRASEVVVSPAAPREKGGVPYDLCVECAGELRLFVSLVNIGEHERRLVGLAVERVPCHNVKQPSRGRAIRTLGVVVLRDAEVSVGEDFLYVAELLLHLRNERALRILLQENLKFLFGGLSLAAVAIRFFHSLVMRHANLHLGVGSFIEEREKSDEILVFVDGLGHARRAALFVIGIRDGQFRFRKILAIRVSVDQRL